MRIVFMGSSQASATCLHAILRLPGLQVVGLVTQPDRPAGRGRDLTPCPCRRYATERGIVDCITPENVNAPEAVAWIRERRPDVIAVVAFGQFLKEEILTLPRHGCVNCREMEARVWSDPEVLERLREDFVILALYVDDKTKLPESEWITTPSGKVLKDVGRVNSQLVYERFGVNSQPNYLILDPEGNILAGPYSYNLSISDFLNFLKQ